MINKPENGKKKRLKDKLVSHIVNATTKHKQTVVILTVVLLTLSIISTAFLAKIDFQFKGMIGDNVEALNKLDDVMKDFNVSGTVTVGVEPKKENLKKLENLYTEFYQMIYNIIQSNYIDTNQSKIKLINIYKEYADPNAFFSTLTDKETLNITIEMLRLMEPSERKELLNTVKDLDKGDKEKILNKLNNYDDEANLSIYRKLNKLDKDSLSIIINYVDKFDYNMKDRLIKHIIRNLSTYQNISYIEGLDFEKETIKNNELDKLNRIDGDINEIINLFIENAQIFAKDLNEILLSDEISPSNFSNKQIDEIVSGVIYSDEMSLSNDRQMYIITITPAISIADLENTTIFAETIKFTIDNMAKDYPNLNIKATGFPILQIEENNALTNNFGIMMIITLIGILLIFLIGLKRIVYPLLSILPLVIGLIIMFGIFSVISGLFNILTLITPIVLLGFGIDYAIHFGVRYGEARGELGSEAPQSEVLTETFNSVGIGLTVSVLTSVFAFLSLLASSIKGFRDMGIITSIGVVTVFLAMIYLLPILVTWRERKHSKGRGNYLREKKFFGLGRFTLSISGIVIGVIILIISLGGFLYIPKLETEEDIMKIQIEGLEGLELQRKLEKKYESSDTHTFFVLDSYEQLINFRQEISKTNENGTKVYPTINTSMVMDARRAISTMEKQGWDKNIETLDKYINKYAEKSGMFGTSNKIIAQYYDFVIRNYVNWESGKYLIMVPPSGYIWDEDVLKPYMKDIGKLESKFNTTGVGMIKLWDFIDRNMMPDLLTASLIAFGIVILIQAFASRSLRGTLLTSFSLLISIVSTLTIMSIFNIKLNFINVMAFPLIIGLGIAYSVHIFFRMVEADFNLMEALSSTGKAILLTTLTTLLAFGTFIFSVHTGLASIGQITTIGLSLCFLSSIFVFPLLARIFYKNKISKKI